MIGPFLGYLIIFNIQLNEYLLYGNNILKIKFSTLEISQALYHIYIGISLVGIAQIIFTIFCPKEIKENSNVICYVSNKNHISSEKFHMIASQCGFLNRPAAGRLANAKSKSILLFRQKERFPDETKCQILEAHWSKLEDRWALFQGLAISLYFVGFLSLALPSVSTFVKVLAAYRDQLQ